MSKIFTQIPEELFDHILWRDCSEIYKWCFIIILRRTAFTDQPKQGIKKGQVHISSQQVADDVFELIGIKIPRTTAWRVINHFMGLNSHKKPRGDGAALLQLSFVKQKVKQNVERESKLYNVLLKGYYEIHETESETVNGTASETEVKQRWNSLPRENDDRILESKNLKETNNSPKGEVVASSTQRLFSFDEEKKEIKGITNKDIEGWIKQYPLIDPLSFFPAMSKWLLSNRSKEQRKVIHRKFITEWLQKHNFQAEMEVKKEEEIQSPSMNIHLSKNREEAQKFVIRYSKLICEYQSIELCSSHLIFKDKTKDQKIQIPFIENDFTNQMNGLKNYFTFRRENEELYA